MRHAPVLVGLVALALMGAGAGALAKLKAGQRLGAPGVKTRPIPGSIRLAVELPEQVLDYHSEALETEREVLETLPPDTSFGQRRYEAPDGFNVLLSVVLMGSDRTSLHKPQFCLTGGGWQIDTTERAQVRVARPQPYDLPVVKLTAGREVSLHGQVVRQRLVFVYWFVCDGALSGEPTGRERMWWMARELLRHGVLQRWAYVICYAACLPGQEALTYERLQQFIAAAVPEFQLTPRPADPPEAAAR